MPYFASFLRMENWSGAQNEVVIEDYIVDAFKFHPFFHAQGRDRMIHYASACLFDKLHCEISHLSI